MMNDIGIDKKQQRYIIKKMINIAIRATYYIFCCRNRNWDSPDLMQFWIFFLAFVLLLFLLLFLFSLFNNPISSSICKLPIPGADYLSAPAIRSEIYNCTFKNTNKVSIIIIIIYLFSLKRRLMSANHSTQLILWIDFTGLGRPMIC